MSFLNNLLIPHLLFLQLLHLQFGILQFLPLLGQHLFLLLLQRIQLLFQQEVLVF